MTFKAGDIVFTSVAHFIRGNATRLIGAKIETMSHDGKKAIVQALPPHPNKKGVINAEYDCVGFRCIIESNLLYRDEQHQKDSAEIRVGDIVILLFHLLEPKLATVTLVTKANAKTIDSNGREEFFPLGNMMVVSRPE